LTTRKRERAKEGNKARSADDADGHAVRDDCCPPQHADPLQRAAGRLHEEEVIVMRAQPLFAAVVGLSLVAGLARADIPGVYSTTQRVDGGSIKYTLSLRENGDAELSSERGGRPSSDGNSVRDYGRILTYLDATRTVSHTGHWSRRGGAGESFTVQLDDLDVGADRRRAGVTLSGSVDRDRLRLQRWDERLYGERTQFEFSRVSDQRSDRDRARDRDRDNPGGRRPSLGIPSDRSEVIRELNYTSRGAGTTRVGGTLADDLRLRDVRVRLDRNGDAEVELRTRAGARQVLRGTWKDSGPVQGGGRRVSVDLRSGEGLLTVRGGSGEVYMRNAREVDRLNFRGVRGDREAGQNFEFDFECSEARG
jgi:hypothetical protein